MSNKHFRLEVSTVKRGKLESMTAKSAYTGGILVKDERTGTTHDYRRRQKTVEAVWIIVPKDCQWATDPCVLWNAAERAEKRKKSWVGREFKLSLYPELSNLRNEELLNGFGELLVSAFDMGVQTNMHRKGHGDWRNKHGHILATTRTVTPQGLGHKLREFDNRDMSGSWVEFLRHAWARLVNRAFENAKLPDRVDPRSYARQGLQRIPGVHHGKTLSAQIRHLEAAFGELGKCIGLSGVETLSRELLRANAEPLDPNTKPTSSLACALIKVEHGGWLLHPRLREALQERQPQLKKSTHPQDRVFADAIRYLFLVDLAFSQSFEARLDRTQQRQRGGERDDR